MKNNTRRIAAAVLAFCITAGIMPAMNYRTVFPTAYAAEEEGTYVAKDGMVYTEYSDHISLYYCEPDGDTLYIPDIVDGKPVTEIADNSFSVKYVLNLDFSYPSDGTMVTDESGKKIWDLSEYTSWEKVPGLSSDVKKVYIPEGVEVIGVNAFYDCDLSEVHLPSTIKKVGDYAFAYNHSLNVYGLPETAETALTSFYDSRFLVDDYSNFIVKDGMYYIEYPDHISMLYCEPDGDTLYIPDTVNGKPVTVIGENAFAVDSFEKMSYPDLPETVRKVYIPEGVELINAGAFAGDFDKEGIYEVHLPSTLKRVCDRAFYRNKNLNVFGLPETAKVGSEAFGCTRYWYDIRANFIVKDGMYYWEYPDHIFLSYCEPDGDTLYIPDTIDGKPVTVVCYEYDPEEKLFKTPELPDSVKKIYIPEGVEEVGGFTNYDRREGLYEVYLPSTLKRLCAFGYNTKLNVYGLPETAEIEDGVLDNTRYDVYNHSNFVVKDGMVYYEYPDHIVFCNCEPDGDTIVFPDMVNGKPVTVIDTLSGREHGIIPDSVKKVYIPEGVELVEGFVNYDGREGLSEVHFPSTLKMVYRIAFEGNKNLKIFDLPETAVVMDDAFNGTPYEGKFTTAAYGDVNLDGKVTLADSLAILQFIANEDKYPLSAEAQKNADCYNPGDGITGNDAVAVMRYDTNVVVELPIFEK